MYFLKIRNAVRHLRWRYSQYGLQSMWTAAKTYFLNTIRKFQNRFLLPRVECPCCGWKGYGFRYLDCGWFIVPQVECPACKAHERHRFFTLYLKRTPPLFLKEVEKRKEILHFAPEHHFRKILESSGNLYLFSTDYNPSALLSIAPPRFVADIHNLPIKEGEFEGIVCLHVLEHVVDDRKALDELLRILSTDGELLLMVPFMMGQKETTEYGAPRPDIFDHVRAYSPLDFKERLQKFDFEEIKPEKILSQEEINKYKIPDSQILYVCRKKRTKE